MNALRIYAVGVLVSAALVAVIFAPLLGLPMGATPSTGESMGDSGPVLNIYVDAEPEIGDIIILDAGETGLSNERVVHRVVGESEQGYTTQGDATPFVDQHVGVVHATDETTVGVVVARVSITDLSLYSTLLALLGMSVSQIKNRCE